jgi:hypothetical protein
MKGFLHRALESARGADQRLKALAGSVYAGNHRRQESQRENWGEETVFAPATPADAQAPRQHPQPGIPRTAPPAATEILLPLRPESGESAIGGNRIGNENQRSPSAAHSTVSLSAAPSDPQNATLSQSPRDLIQAPSQALLPLRAGNPPRQSGFRVNEPSHAEVTAPQAPQQISRADLTHLSEGSRRAAPVSPPKLSPLMRDGVAAKPPIASPQLPQLRNRPQQEPQVQVHIGRIEVIAAAPQPPRVPTPRPSRATSLADYLAGRNGRSS